MNVFNRPWLASTYSYAMGCRGGIEKGVGEEGCSGGEEGGDRSTECREGGGRAPGARAASRDSAGPSRGGTRLPRNASCDGNFIGNSADDDCATTQFDSRRPGDHQGSGDDDGDRTGSNVTEHEPDDCRVLGGDLAMETLQEQQRQSSNQAAQMTRALEMLVSRLPPQHSGTMRSLPEQ